MSVLLYVHHACKHVCETYMNIYTICYHISGLYIYECCETVIQLVSQSVSQSSLSFFLICLGVEISNTCAHPSKLKPCILYTAPFYWWDFPMSNIAKFLTFCYVTPPKISFSLPLWNGSWRFTATKKNWFVGKENGRFKQEKLKLIFLIVQQTRKGQMYVCWRAWSYTSRLPCVLVTKLWS